MPEARVLIASLLSFVLLLPQLQAQDDSPRAKGKLGWL